MVKSTIGLTNQEIHMLKGRQTRQSQFAIKTRYDTQYDTKLEKSI